MEIPEKPNPETEYLNFDIDIGEHNPDDGLSPPKCRVPRCVLKKKYDPQWIINASSEDLRKKMKVVYFLLLQDYKIY